MLLDSAEAVLSVFGFNRTLFGFDRKKAHHWYDEIYQQRERDIELSYLHLMRMCTSYGAIMTQLITTQKLCLEHR
jgi:hypothetical protein